MPCCCIEAEKYGIQNCRCLDFYLYNKMMYIPGLMKKVPQTAEALVTCKKKKKKNACQCPAVFKKQKKIHCQRPLGHFRPPLSPPCRRNGCAVSGFNWLNNYNDARNRCVTISPTTAPRLHEQRVFLSESRQSDAPRAHSCARPAAAARATLPCTSSTRHPFASHRTTRLFARRLWLRLQHHSSAGGKLHHWHIFQCVIMWLSLWFL
jgi:hypothetical protein